MTRKEHRLTIGLPVYNAERYLESAAQSILAQSYENFDLLIADNASTDRTQTICRELSRRDSRVRYVRHAENIGVVPNHNFTAEAARGELFRWAADDDLIEPTALEKCVALLDEEGPGTVLTFPQTEVIGEHGEHVMYWSEQGSVTNDAPDERLRALLEHPRGHLRSGFLSPFYGVMRASVLHNTSLLRYFYPADVVLIVELVLRGKFAEVPEPLYLRRQHAGQSGGWSAHTELERNVWAYPGFRGYPMTRTRIMKGHIEAVLDAPLTSAERRRCLAAVGAALIRGGTTRIILGEIVRATQARIDSGLGRIRLRGSYGP
jgi:glycosyltransferase involved in cell wall biosynthesis